MKTILKIKCVVILLIVITLSCKSQNLQSRYAIETTLGSDKTPVVYKENYGEFRFNSNTGELFFSTNLGNLKTGNKNTDSLLLEKGLILFTFTANLGQNLFELIDQQNDDKYHKILGTVVVNNVSYNAEAFVKLKNISEKSNLSKLLMDLKLDIDPKVIKIPILSDYFKNILLFHIEENWINQNK
jgi:hypothetical protein